MTAPAPHKSHTTLLVFFALGAVLFLLRRAPAPPLPGPAPLVVRLQEGQALQAAVDEALLVELALARGAALTDPVVRDRMLSAMHAAGVDDMARALSLGLASADPIARQRLRFHGEAALATVRGPADAQLDTYLAQNALRYQGPERLDLEHIFVGAKSDAPARAAELAAGRVRSDPSLLPRRASAATVAEVSARFGDAVGHAVATAPTGVWVGPVRSPFGEHFVRVLRRRAGEAPPREVLRRRAAADWLAETRAERLGSRLAALRLGRPLRVERQAP